MAVKGDDVVERWTKLRDDRGLLDTELDEVARIVAPQRLWHERDGYEQEGQKRTQRRFTSAADTNALQLATSLESLNSPKNEQWIRAKAAGVESSEENLQARGWLDLFEERIWDEIYSPSGGGQVALSSCYHDFVVDGTCIIWAEERPGVGAVSRRVPLREGWLDANGDGEIDSLYMRDRMTIRQIVTVYGEASLSQNLQRVARNDQDSRVKFEIIRCARPRPTRDPRSRLSTDMPYEYAVVEEATKHVIVEGGFQEKPFAVARWSVPAGEIYGWGPARAALPDIKSLNVVARYNTDGMMLRTVPPALVAADSSLRADRIRARGVVPFDPELAQKLGIPPAQWMQIANDGQMGLMLEERLRRDIADIFLKYLLQMPTEGPAMTATEIIERRQQFVRMYAPIDSNLKTLNRDYVERIANIILRRPYGTPGAMPPPPDDLESVEFEFESPVQRAIDEIKARKAQMALAELGGLIQLDPQIIDNFDTDTIARDVPLNLGWPADWLRDRRVVASIREQRAEQQAQQAGMQAMMEVAKTPGAQPMIEQTLGQPVAA